MHLLDADMVRREVPDTPATLEYRVIACQQDSTAYRSGSGLLLVEARRGLLGALGEIDPHDIAQIQLKHDLHCELLADVPAHLALQNLIACQRARICTLAAPWQLPRTSNDQLTIRPLSSEDRTNHVPGELREEIRGAHDAGRVFAGFVDGRAVSFAYALMTETLADVSIDTLSEYRNRGIGRAVVATLIDELVAVGKTPVWGAVESNLASLQLAEILGFTAPAGELFVADDWW